MGLYLKRKSTQKLLKFYDLRVQTYWLNEFDWPELDFNQSWPIMSLLIYHHF